MINPQAQVAFSATSCDLPCIVFKNVSSKSAIRITNKKSFLRNVALVRGLNKELTPTDLCNI